MIVRHCDGTARPRRPQDGELRLGHDEQESTTTAIHPTVERWNWRKRCAGRRDRLIFCCARSLRNRSRTTRGHCFSFYVDKLICGFYARGASQVRFCDECNGNITSVSCHSLPYGLLLNVFQFVSHPKALLQVLSTDSD